MEGMASSKTNDGSASSGSAPTEELQHNSPLTDDRTVETNAGKKRGVRNERGQSSYDGNDDPKLVATTTPAQQPAPPLPLGWTRVRRNNNGKIRSDSSSRHDEETPCDDPACCRRRRNPWIEKQRQQREEQRDRRSNSSTAAKRERLRGTAMFCLHETNPEWFQGYFFPNSSGTTATTKIKSFGLLCVQEEIDDCLACSEGGFRQVQMTVDRFAADRSAASAPQKSNSKRIVMPEISWTGGDMIRLRGDHVDAVADQLWTGSGAVPYVNSFFGGLVRNLVAQQQRQPNDNNRESNNNPIDVLDLIPDVAIVKTSMTLLLPTNDE